MKSEEIREKIIHNNIKFKPEIKKLGKTLIELIRTIVLNVWYLLIFIGLYMLLFANHVAKKIKKE